MSRALAGFPAYESRLKRGWKNRQPRASLTTDWKSVADVAVGWKPTVCDSD